MHLGIQRRTDLAISLLRALPPGSEPTPGSVIAERIGTTSTFLPQIVAPLIDAGWVSSERGPGGGYRLTDTAPQASLLEVIEAMEGPSQNGRCVLRDAACPGDDECPIHRVWVSARDVLVAGFEGIPAISTEGATT